MSENKDGRETTNQLLGCILALLMLAIGGVILWVTLPAFIDMMGF